jgi:hypothetical protein
MRRNDARSRAWRPITIRKKQPTRPNVCCSSSSLLEMSVLIPWDFARYAVMLRSPYSCTRSGNISTELCQRENLSQHESSSSDCGIVTSPDSSSTGMSQLTPPQECFSCVVDGFVARKSKLGRVGRRIVARVGILRRTAIARIVNALASFSCFPTEAGPEEISLQAACLGLLPRPDIHARFSNMNHADIVLNYDRCPVGLRDVLHLLECPTSKLGRWRHRCSLL